MPFLFSTQGSVALVRWMTPIAEDIERLIWRVQQVERAAGPPILVFLVPEDVPPPAADVARAIVRRMPDVGAACRSIHHVFLGNGFAISLKRSILTGMLLAASKLPSSRRRLPYTVHASLEEVAAALTSSQRSDLLALTSAARAA